MGKGIAQVSAMGGHKVVLYDVKNDFLDKSIASIEKSLAKSKVANIDQVLSRIKATTDIDEACVDPDIVIEAVVEKLDIKRDLFSHVHKIAPKETILTTNTSSLSVTEICNRVRPQKFAGLHFFSPVPKMKLVELVKTVETSPETLKALQEFSESIDKQVVVCKDSPGFIVNRLLVPYLLNSIQTVEDGVSSLSNIDTAMKLGCGYPMGPFELLDNIGLDTVKLILDAWHELDPIKFPKSRLLDDLVSKGHLGRKSGRGFYSY